MKSRNFFHCFAVVALVLTVAAVPSHATERRDPLIVPDATQTQPAKSSGSGHAATSAKKQAPKSAQKQKGTSASVAKKSSHEGAGSSSATK
jgi:hypothetical protein